MAGADVTGARLLSLQDKTNICNILKTGYTGRSMPSYKYYILRRYMLSKINGTEKIIRKADGRIIATNDEASDIIRLKHEELKHGSERETWCQLRKTYGNISKYTVREYINKCQQCQEKKCKTYESLLNATSFDLNHRGHIDVIEMTPDGEYRNVLHYTFVKYKFSILRPLRNGSPKEVADSLLSIFIDFGSPHVLQSNSRKFTTDVIKELKTMWSQLVFINGKYEEAHTKLSLSVKEKLESWMATNKSVRWSKSITLIQWQMNTVIYQGFTVTPYQLIFNRKPSLGVAPIRSVRAYPANSFYEEEITPLLQIPRAKEGLYLKQVNNKMQTNSCEEEFIIPDNLPSNSQEQRTDCTVVQFDQSQPLSAVLENGIPFSPIECDKSASENTLWEPEKTLKIANAYSLATGERILLERQDRLPCNELGT